MSLKTRKRISGMQIGLIVLRQIVVMTFIFTAGCTLTKSVSPENKCTNEIKGIDPDKGTSFKVKGADPACDSGIRLKHDQYYKFSVIYFSPKWADGHVKNKDKNTKLDETGWNHESLAWYEKGVIAFSRLKQCPNGDWFEIVGGTMNSNDEAQYYRFGEGIEEGKILHYLGEDNQPLIIFANDWIYRYHNNFGTMKINISLADKSQYEEKGSFLACD